MVFSNDKIKTIDPQDVASYEIDKKAEIIRDADEYNGVLNMSSTGHTGLSRATIVKDEKDYYAYHNTLSMNVKVVYNSMFLGKMEYSIDKHLSIDGCGGVHIPVNDIGEYFNKTEIIKKNIQIATLLMKNKDEYLKLGEDIKSRIFVVTHDICKRNYLINRVGYFKYLPTNPVGHMELPDSIEEISLLSYKILLQNVYGISDEKLKDWIPSESDQVINEVPDNIKLEHYVDFFKSIYETIKSFVNHSYEQMAQSIFSRASELTHNMMHSMNLIGIVAIEPDSGVIGYDGKNLAWSKNKSDMNHFVEMTKGGTLILGRKTFLSIGKVLDRDRDMIVLTSEKNPYKKFKDVIGDMRDSVYFCKTKEEALVLATKISPHQAAMVIGGTSIYKAYENDIQGLIISLIKEENLLPEVKALIKNGDPDKRLDIYPRDSEIPNTRVIEYDFQNDLTIHCSIREKEYIKDFDKLISTSNLYNIKEPQEVE